MRKEATEQLVSRVQKHIEDLPEEAVDVRNRLLTKAEYYFSNSSLIWPLHYSAFYLGHVPVLNNDIKLIHFPNNQKYQRFIRNLHSEFHLAGIRLAGRIMGEFLRELAKKREQEGTEG